MFPAQASEPDFELRLGMLAHISITPCDIIPTPTPREVPHAHERSPQHTHLFRVERAELDGEKLGRCSAVRTLLAASTEGHIPH